MQNGKFFEIWYHVQLRLLFVLIYVTGILLFPFAQKDWSIKYNQEEPVQPKYDVNASDLYIPCMGYITYILVVGYILGLRNTFR